MVTVVMVTIHFMFFDPCSWHNLVRKGLMVVVSDYSNLLHTIKLGLIVINDFFLLRRIKVKLGLHNYPTSFKALILLGLSACIYFPVCIAYYYCGSQLRWDISISNNISIRNDPRVIWWLRYILYVLHIFLQLF